MMANAEWELYTCLTTTASDARSFQGELYSKLPQLL